MNEFDKIYASNSWRAGSGIGSLAKRTTGYRKFIELFLQENSIKSVVDYGCGDWQFSHLIDWGEVKYIGVDVASAVIDANTRRYARKNVEFRLVDPHNLDLPSADLLISKDVIQHLSDEDVNLFLKKILPKYKYALITNCVWPESDLNTPIKTGGFRPLDIRRGPFNVGATAVYSFDWQPRQNLLRVLLRRRAWTPWKKIVLLIDNSRSASTIMTPTPAD